MERAITVDGKEVKMRASALIPRLYRFKFGRDMIRDLAQLKKNFEAVTKNMEDASEDEKRKLS